MRKPDADIIADPIIAEAILNSAKWADVAAAAGKGADDNSELQWMSEPFAELLSVASSGHSPLAKQLHDSILAVASSALHYPGPLKAVLAPGSDGEIPVEVVAAPSSSEPDCWAAIISDARSSNEIEQAVRQCEQWFEALVNSLAESVWIVQAGQAIYANPAALTLLQMTESELQKTPFLDWVHKDDRQLVEQSFCRVLQGETVPPYECQLSPGNSQTAFVELSSVAFNYGGGGATLSFGRDITERKRLEASMLQSDRLASLGMLAGGMAHSLNDPLTSVLLNLDHLAAKLPLIAGDASAVADSLARLKEAREGAERMANIVKRMRNLARADDSEIRAVDLGSVLESVVEIVGNEIRHRGRLTTAIGRVPPVVANEARIEQVCLGLVLFVARILLEDSAKTNEVRLSLYTDDHENAIVEIVCDGVELDASQLRSLSEPFPSGPETPPTGFGLGVCSSIVDQLGGQIKAESSPSTGLCLKVVLPCSKSFTTEPPPPSSQHSSNPPSSETGSARILVVDDDPGVGRALRLMLEEEHDVTCYTSPREALKRLLQDHEFDLVFCDLMMPELTGMDIYQVLRFNRPGYEARIVFMTGGAFTASAKRFLAQVPNARIEKPFNLRALQRMVHRSIAQRR